MKDLQVKTESGVIEGVREGSVRAFLGVPYAAPPVGALRWKAPEAPLKFDGVRQTKAFGARCMQPAIYPDMVFRDAGGSEDCLMLNVWTTAKSKKDKQPVMVWIHGGGYLAGASSEPRQDGTELAKNGVVVVSMNYRMGIFGFYTHPELAKESGHHSSGNYGLLDQVKALAWVKKNIAGFGGDPSNVTVFGESAGSFSVSAIMASPLAKGLFQKAIGESGAAFNSSGLSFPSHATTEAKDAEFGKTAFNADSLEQLRAIPAQQLMEASMKVPSPRGEARRFTAVVDGYFLPEPAPAIFAEKKQSDVPLLAGWNLNEGGGPTREPAKSATVASLKAMADNMFGAKADELLKVYGVTTDADAPLAASALAADQFIAFSTWKWIEAQTEFGTKPVYRYRFDLAPPADKFHPDGSGAYHSAEIPYVFGALDVVQGMAWTPADRALSEQMRGYWSNFAKTGDPNGPGLPNWPMYSAKDGYRVMYLQPGPAAETDRTRERDLFLDGVWGK